MWKVSDSVDMYAIDRWGADYFDVDASGNVTVSPEPGGPAVTLASIIHELRGRGMRTPLLLRFPQILDHRVRSLHGAFDKAVKEFGYTGAHRAVFPFKVNQRKEVIRSILGAGQRYNMGLEVGTKAELVAAASMDMNPDSLLICNGFKDEGYLRLALDLGSLGKPIFLVVEEVDELRRIISIGKETGWDRCAAGKGTMLGLRIKLYSKGSGRWAQSGGELAKFGLTASEVVQCLDLLEGEGLKDRLRMVHFHIGSQITQIRRIQRAVKEAVRKYTRIRSLGFDVTHFNVGGGMGVDYDGSRSASHSSANYTVQEYANDVVYSLFELCTADSAPMPDIVTESGRAVAAHHSVLVTAIMGVLPERTGRPSSVPEGSRSRNLAELMDLHENINPKNYAEYFHDAVVRRDDMLSSFEMGLVTLRELGTAESLYTDICLKARRYAVAADDQSEEFWDLPKLMARKYIGNFSVFQSMPDAWAIKHLFPIMPVARLNEQPSQQAKLADITCDSDGEVHRYIDHDDYPEILNVHSPGKNEPYYVGIFLLGAYQDTIGDFHNMLGYPDEAFVRVEGDGEFSFPVVYPGHCVSTMLRDFNFDTEDVRSRFASWVRERQEAGEMDGNAAERLLRDHDAVLSGSTYLDNGW